MQVFSCEIFKSTFFTEHLRCLNLYLLKLKVILVKEKIWVSKTYLKQSTFLALFHFMVILPFHPPWKHQKISGFKKQFSSRPEVFCKKGFLKNFTNFKGKHIARVSFLIKLQTKPATLLKKRLWHSCCPVNFTKFLQTPFK